VVSRISSNRNSSKKEEIFGLSTSSIKICPVNPPTSQKVINNKCWVWVLKSVSYLGRGSAWFLHKEMSGYHPRRYPG